MGSVVAETTAGVENPRVGLLNNGSEDSKGREMEREGLALLREAPVNFLGNVEGSDFATGKVDVIVTDGFTGNVFLKTVEASVVMSAKAFFSMLAESEPEAEEKVRPRFLGAGPQADGRPSRRSPPGGRQGHHGHRPRARPQFGHHQGAGDGPRGFRVPASGADRGAIPLPLDHLQRRLGYRFSSPELLLNALTHSSYANEMDTPDNERLEFLGDTVLQMVVTRHIFAEYPFLKEGQMTRVRAAVVRKESLAQVAEALDLGEALRLGKGQEQSGGRCKVSILADAMEAVIGAVYQDGGWNPAESLVIAHWRGMIDSQAAIPDALDAKTQLQELLASEAKTPRVPDLGGGSRPCSPVPVRGMGGGGTARSR